MNSAELEKNKRNSSMVEINSLISAISAMIENSNDKNSMLEIIFSISLISLNCAMIENNNDKNNSGGDKFLDFLEFRHDSE